MYYFCNFMEKEIERFGGRLKSKVVVSDKLDSNVQVADCYEVVDELGNKNLKFVCMNEFSDGKRVDFLGKFSCERVNSTEKELMSTDDNPIIIVATKKFQLFTGIPTYIKYLPVKDGVLVALVKGYIAVEDKEGKMLPLSRNCDAILNGTSHTYNAESIKNLNIIKEQESGILFSNYVVNDCVISHTVAKDGSKLKSIKFNKENFVMLNNEVFEEERKRKVAELKAIEEEKKRRAEEVARINAEYKKKMMEEEAEAKNKKARKTSTRKSSSNKQEEKVVTGSSGAQFFLNCLSNMN